MPEMQVQPISSLESEATRSDTPVVDLSDIFAVSGEGAKTGPARAEKPGRSEHIFTGKPRDVRLQFIVNDETNEVTICVIDRATKSILRVIPSDELKQMKAGSLLELFV